MQRRHYFRIILLALLCASLLQIISGLPFAGQQPVASAYAFVIGSEPIDGSTITKAPALVRIFFDAPVGTASRIQVYAFPAGGPANGQLVSTGPSVVNATDPRELDVPLLPADKLPLGGYSVRWTAISLTDGRSTSGLIGFNYGYASTGLSGTPLLGPTTSNYFPQLNLQGLLAIAWDWLVLVALFFWIGILVTDYFLLPRSSSASLQELAHKRSRPLQALCLAALLVGEVINLILRSTSFTSLTANGGIDIDALAQLAFHTLYGYLWLLRVVLLSAALLLLWWTGYRQFQQEKSPDLALADKGRSSKRFRQLRQQARPEITQDSSASARSTLPAPARSQARVTGAVAANASSTRGKITASLPRINGNVAPTAATTAGPSLWSRLIWLVLAALVLLTLALSDEITQVAPLHLSAAIFSWLALASQAVWFGCLAYPGLSLFPMLPTTDPDHAAEDLLSVLKHATPFLLAAVGVLAISDIFLTEATISAPAQLLQYPYGRATLVRGGLLLLVLLCTGYILFYLLPRLQRQTVLLPVVDAELPARRTRKFKLEKTTQSICRSLHLLSGGAAAVLLCSAIMSFFSPPVVYPDVNYAALVNAANSATPATQPTSSTQQAGDLSVTLQVQPARAGVTNTLLVTLKDAQGRAVTDATVKASINMEIMDMGTTNTTLAKGDAGYTVTLSGDQTFTMEGLWAIQVEITRPNQQPATLTFRIMVAA